MALPDEVVNIFDENRKKIGTAWLWKEAHKKGLLHETVAALVFKDKTKKQLLIQQRGMILTQDPGKWSHSTGGHLPAELDPLTGIKKELQEELFHEHDLPQFNIQEVAVVDIHDFPMNREFLHIYEAVYPGPFWFDPEEVYKAEWRNVEELKKEMQDNPAKFTPSFHTIFKTYFNL